MSNIDIAFIKDLLDAKVAQINVPEFIPEDPVQFPRLFSDMRDIEITSLLVSAIAWGNRRMILRDAARMLALMDNQPYAYMMDKGYEELPYHQNIHRTFFTENLQYFLRGLRSLYVRYGTLDAFAAAHGIGSGAFPAWELARLMNAAFADANGGAMDARCIPASTDSTALKRLNMALRWLVRTDGIVDMGVWKSLTPDRLYIPLDVHVGNISRGLGMLTRRSNDRKAVDELTQVLRKLNPEDPVIYDFALFGIGVKGETVGEGGLVSV